MLLPTREDVPGMLMCFLLGLLLVLNLCWRW